MKEGVDRLHAKEVVVMGEQREYLSRVGSHSHRPQPRLLHHLLHIGVRARQTVGYAVELREDTEFHLLCGLVGEGHGEDVSVVLGVADEE